VLKKKNAKERRQSVSDLKKKRDKPRRRNAWTKRIPKLKREKLR